VSKDDTLTIEITIKRSELANPAIADSVVGNHIYLLVSTIFEWGGEYNRRPDGTPVLRCHGHSVAQGLADTAVARWKQYETKTEEGA
jgi:hypothetical protein